MIEPNNNLSVLPFYNSLARQNHRKSYAYGAIYPLFTPYRKILPFQILRPTNPNTIIQSVQVFDEHGNFVFDITQNMLDTGLKIIPHSEYGYDVIIYTGIWSITKIIPQGIHYLVIKDALNTYYSEMFTVVQSDLSGYLLIEWWDADTFYFDAGCIDYSYNFKNKLYLCTQLGKPEYPFTEDVEDRDGYVFVRKQISEKTYHFVFLAPEYLLDAIRLIRMSDFVRITADGQQYMCDSFLETSKWEVQGNLASVEAEFETGTVVKKIGRGDIQITGGGDFNPDFNHDYYDRQEEPQQFTVTVESNDENMGTVSATPSILAYGTNSTIEAIAKPGYRFSNWQSGNNPKYVKNIIADYYDKATFIPLVYNLTAIVDIDSQGYGSANVNPTQVNTGQSATFTATPNPGYSFFKWLFSDGTESETAVTIKNNITSDLEGVASFIEKPITYNLSAIVASGSTNMGSASVSPQQVNAGGSAYWLATPNFGYTFDHWEFSDGSTSNSPGVTKTGIFQDIVGTAYFKGTVAQSVDFTGTVMPYNGMWGIHISSAPDIISDGSGEVYANGVFFINPDTPEEQIIHFDGMVNEEGYIESSAPFDESQIIGKLNGEITVNNPNYTVGNVNWI